MSALHAYVTAIASGNTHRIPESITNHIGFPVSSSPNVLNGRRQKSAPYICSDFPSSVTSFFMLGFREDASQSTSCYDALVPPAVAIEIVLFWDVLPLGKDTTHLSILFK